MDKIGEEFINAKKVFGDDFKVYESTSSNIFNIVKKQEKKKKSKRLKNKHKENKLKSLIKPIKLLNKLNEGKNKLFESLNKNIVLIIGGIMLAAAALMNANKGGFGEGSEEGYDYSGYLGSNGRYDENTNNAETNRKNKVKNKIITEAERQGVDPSLALAVAEHESIHTFNNKVKSPSGAIGIFQLMPATAAGLKVNPHNEDENIRGGVTYLKAQLKRFNGDEKSALAAYNAGPYAVEDFLHGTNKTGLNPNRIKTPHGIPPWKGKAVNDVGNYVAVISKTQQRYKNELGKLKAPNITGTGVQAAHTGPKIGNAYKASNKVEISPQMKVFLEESGVHGTITSGIRQSGPYNRSSHRSGNKADIGFGNVSYENIIKTCIEVMSHPAIVHVGYEGFGRKGNNRDSDRISIGIVNEIKRRRPDLAARMTTNENKAWNTDKFMVYHWGWRHGANGPHIDFLINPNRLNNKISYVNDVNKTTELAMNNLTTLVKQDEENTEDINNLQDKNNYENNILASNTLIRNNNPLPSNIIITNNMPLHKHTLHNSGKTIC